MSGFGTTYIAKSQKEEDALIAIAIAKSLNNSSKQESHIKLSDVEKLAEDFRRRNPDYVKQIDSLYRSNTQFTN
jgi:hypothetical protein